MVNQNYYRAAFPAAPSLVGRERELSMLRAALAEALAGHGGLVLISGEAGIGKTALAEALLTEATVQGALVLVGRCYDLSETPPHGPWMEALVRAPRAAGTAQAPTLTGEMVVASQVALFATLRDHFAALAARQPLVVLLDDLHWADHASLDLLRFLARGLAELPLLLLGTYRADEVRRGDSLYALLPLLVREARAARLDLRPLDDDDLRSLVRAHHPLPPWDEARLVVHLGERSGGNPFFAGELLRALVEQAVLRPTGAAAWALGALAGVPVPTLLRQVIDTRVARLGEGAYHLLGLAATIGQDIPLALWRAADAVAGESLTEVVTAAVAAGVVREAQGGREVRFTHALIRETLYAGVALSQRQIWHRRIGEALLRAAVPDPDAVAYHLRRAGDPRAADWLLRAGDRARQSSALVMAGERYAAALALVETTAAPPREQGWIAFRLALDYAVADPERSLQAFAQASALAELADDDGLQAGIGFCQGFISGTAGQMRHGIAAMEAALPRIAALPPAERERLWATVGATGTAGYDPRGLLTHAFAATGRFADALDLGGGVVPPTPSDEDEVVRGEFRMIYAATYHGLAIAHAGQGRPEDARRAFAAARAQRLAARDDDGLGLLAREELAWVVLPYQADRLADRQQLAESGMAAWRRASGARGAIPATALIQTLLFAEGRWAEARAVAEEVIAIRRSGPPRMIAGGVLAAVARGIGDLDVAWGHAVASLPAPDTAPGDTYILNTLPVQRLAALIALDRGDLPAARRWLAAHDRWRTWADATLGRSEGELAWATYHRASGDPARARSHAARALDHATTPRQPLALLTAQRFLGELALAAGDYREAQGYLDRALVLADACAAPYERALTLLTLAELCAATGDHTETATALGAARAILDPLDARPALARADALAARLAAPVSPPREYPAGLSVREAEVLRLIAHGLTNAQAAERLFIAPRTVNAHLTNIYTKLDVSSRAAATRFAIEHGLA